MKPLAEFRPGGRIRILYADLDGTLVGPGGSLFAAIPEGSTGRGAAALAELHRAGVQLVLVSGRTRQQMREAARILGAAAYIAELGAFLVERGDPDVVVPSFGAFEEAGPAGTPFAAMVRSGAGAFLLDRYSGRLEPHAPWAFEDREATMLLRGLLDLEAATEALAGAGYGWLQLLDNGVIRRRFEGLDVPEVHAYHLVPKGVSKAAAVALHRRRHGLVPAATAAVGDSPSDLDIGAEVGSMFLVANATVDPVVAPANAYLTERPGGDGVAEVIEVLLGEP